MSIQVQGVEVLYEPVPGQVRGIEIEVDTAPYNPNGPCYDSPICD
jgi:hypothetical protein